MFEEIKLSNPEQLTIYCESGSAAESFAKRKEFKYAIYAEVQSVKLDKISISLFKGKSQTIKATINPSNATNKSVTWTSSNKTVAQRTSNSRIATVDKNGNVKTVGTGKVWITAKASNGGEQACTIDVKNAPSKVTISKGVVTIGVGEKFTVGSAVPNGSAAAKRTYRTSISSVVKMTKTSWTGQFKAMKKGTAYVTVRSYNGKEKSCKVNVV